MELCGERELAEHEAALGAAPLGVRDLHDAQIRARLVERVVQVEDEPGVAGEPTDVVRDDPGDSAHRHPGDDGLPTVSLLAPPGLVAAGVRDDFVPSAVGQLCEAPFEAYLVGRVG